MKKESKPMFWIGSLAIAAAGFIFVPRFLQKQSNKIYKSSLEKEKNDLEDFEPVIVPFPKNNDAEAVKTENGGEKDGV